MRTRVLTICFVVLCTTVAQSSGPFYGPREWEHWRVVIEDAYCELQMLHQAIERPFYPDIRFRFHVQLRSQPPGILDRYKNHKLYLWLNTDVNNVPRENKPLHRIESATLDGVQLTRLGDDLLLENDDNYRFFELGPENARKILDRFSKVDHRGGYLELVLTLSNGEKVVKRAPPGRYFYTQARMLSVCMEEGHRHHPPYIEATASPAREE